jgi:hypothetical protein
MSSGKSSEEKRLRAQSHFQKGEERRVEATKVVDHHLARSKAEAAKTARLRALRLAKEADDAVQAKNLSDDMRATISASGKKTMKRKKSPTAGL